MNSYKSALKSYISSIAADIHFRSFKKIGIENLTVKVVAYAFLFFLTCRLNALYFP